MNVFLFLFVFVLCDELVWIKVDAEVVRDRATLAIPYMFCFNFYALKIVVGLSLSLSYLLAHSRISNFGHNQILSKPLKT